MTYLRQQFHFSSLRNSLRMCDPFPEASLGQEIRKPWWQSHVGPMLCKQILLKAQTEDGAIGISSVLSVKREPTVSAISVQRADLSIMQPNRILALRLRHRSTLQSLHRRLGRRLRA